MTIPEPPEPLIRPFGADNLDACRQAVKVPAYQVQLAYERIVKIVELDVSVCDGLLALVYAVMQVLNVRVRSGLPRSARNSSPNN